MQKPRLGDVIGFRKDGRPVRLAGGGAEDEGHPSEGEQEQEGQESGSDESVLDADDGDDGDGEATPEVDVDALAATLEERLGARFDAIADRRVNALLKEVRKRQGAGSDDGSPPAAVPQEDGPDVRTARLAFREYLTDDLKFLSADERKFAMDFGAGLLAQSLVPGSDEDEVGRAVAGQVASQVKTLRKFYEQRTIAGLKRRGALKEQPGQPGKGPGTVGGASEWQAGAELAASMFGDRTQTTP